MLTTIKDVVGVLLLVFLLPVWLALGLGAVGVVVTRQLYWWARRNTSVVSRLGTRVTVRPDATAAPGMRRATVAEPLTPMIAGTVGPPAPDALRPAVAPNV